MEIHLFSIKLSPNSKGLSVFYWKGVELHFPLSGYKPSWELKRFPVKENHFGPAYQDHFIRQI